MSKGKSPNILSPQMEAIFFVILQIFLAKRAVLKIGGHSRISPVLAGDIRSHDVLRPIARERKGLMDYKLEYVIIILINININIVIIVVVVIAIVIIIITIIDCDIEK